MRSLFVAETLLRSIVHPRIAARAGYGAPTATLHLFETIKVL
jgi:hypothetical protein